MKRWKAVLCTSLLFGSMILTGCGAKAVKGNDAKEEQKKTETSASSGDTSKIVTLKKEYSAKHLPKSPISEQGTEDMKKSTKGTLGKVIVVNEEGKSGSTFEQYLMVTMDLGKQTAEVNDVTKAKNKDINADVTKRYPTEKTFSELFGFDNTACSNVNDLYTKLLKTYDMDLSTLDYQLDKNQYEYEGDCSYTFTPSAKLVNAALNGASYDKLDDVTGYLEMYELKDGSLMPEGVIVCLSYDKDGHTYQKSMEVGFTPDGINDKLKDDKGCSCGCGHSDESQCGSECGHNKKTASKSCKDESSCK